MTEPVYVQVDVGFRSGEAKAMLVDAMQSILPQIEERFGDGFWWIRCDELGIRFLLLKAERSS